MAVPPGLGDAQAAGGGAVSITRTTKPTRRLSTGTLVWSAGKYREVITIVGPGAILGFKLVGLRKVYEITSEEGYRHAVSVVVAKEKFEKAAKRAALKGKKWNPRTRRFA